MITIEDIEGDEDPMLDFLIKSDYDRDHNFQLPTKDEIQRNLLKISNNHVLVNRFYPLLTKHADEQVSVISLIILVRSEIKNFSRMNGDIPYWTLSFISSNITELIDALCPDDEIAISAKTFCEQVCY